MAADFYSTAKRFGHAITFCVTRATTSCAATAQWDRFVVGAEALSSIYQESDAYNSPNGPRKRNTRLPEAEGLRQFIEEREIGVIGPDREP